MQSSNCFFCKTESHPKDFPYCIKIKFARRQYTLFTDNNLIYQGFYNALSALVLIKDRPKCVDGMIVRLANLSNVVNSSSIDNSRNASKFKVHQPEESKENTFVRKRMNSRDDLSKYRVNNDVDFFKDRNLSQANINCYESKGKNSTFRTNDEKKENSLVNKSQRFSNFFFSHYQNNYQEAKVNNEVEVKDQKKSKNKTLSYLEKIPSKKFIFEAKNQNFIVDSLLVSKNPINLKNLGNVNDNINLGNQNCPCNCDELLISNNQKEQKKSSNWNLSKDESNQKEREEVIDIDNFQEQTISKQSSNHDIKNIQNRTLPKAFKTQIRHKLNKVQDYNSNYLSNHKNNVEPKSDTNSRFELIQDEANSNNFKRTIQNKKILRIQNKNIVDFNR